MAIIYKIENKVNHKVYIGQSMSTLEWRLNSQWIGHFPLAFERNSKMRVHIALRKYGKDNFTYEVVEERNDGTFEELHKWLDEREKYWISKYDSSNRLRGYNSTKGGQGCAGLHHKLSDEALATRKKTMQKNESSPSFKKWINNGAITKQVHYKEVDNYLKDGWVLGRLKMNKKNPRKPVSQETRDKMSRNRRGKKKPESFRQFMSQRNLGNTYGRGNKGKKFSKERCQKMSEVQKGRRLTDEQKRSRAKTMQKNESSPSFKKWINNGVITKQVHYKEVDNYLKDGWVLGRLQLRKTSKPRKPVSQETRQKLSIAMKKDKTGRVYIYKGDIIKMVKPDKLQSYLDSGWTRGRGPSKRRASNDTKTV